MNYSFDNKPYDVLAFARRLKGSGRQLQALAKRYVDLSSRKSDFVACLASIQAASAFSDSNGISHGLKMTDYQTTVLRSLSTNAIMMYGRAADPQGGRSKLSFQKWLTESELVKHEAVWRLRSKVFAHHVEQYSHQSGVWLFETALMEITELTPGRRGYRVSTFLRRSSHKRAATQAMLELAPKNIAAIEVLIDIIRPEMTAEVSRLLRGNDHNVALLKQCLFDDSIFSSAEEAAAFENYETYSYQQNRSGIDP